MTEDSQAGLSLSGLRSLFHEDKAEPEAPPVYTPAPDPPKSRSDARGILVKIPPKTPIDDVNNLIRDQAWEAGWPSATAVLMESQPYRRKRYRTRAPKFSLRAGSAQGEVSVLSSDAEAITYRVSYHPEHPDAYKAPEPDDESTFVGVDLGTDESTAVAVTTDLKTGVKTIKSIEKIDMTRLGDSIREAAAKMGVSMEAMASAISDAAAPVAKAMMTGAEMEKAMKDLRVPKEPKEPKPKRSAACSVEATATREMMRRASLKSNPRAHRSRTR